MKHISFIKRNLLLALGAIAMLTTSCIKEDLDACKNYKLLFKVVNENENDISPLGECRDANLYIFDESGKLLETRQLDKDFITTYQEIELSKYKSGQKLHLVAWGNLGDQKNLTVTDPEKLEDLKLTLKSEQGIAAAPDSVYFGAVDVVAMDGGIESPTDTVVVRLKTGNYTIITRGYPEYRQNYLKSSDEIGFTLDNVQNTYNYAGVQAGEQIAFAPESTTDNTAEWMSVGERNKNFGGKQNAFAGQNLECTIFVNGQPLKTVTEAEDAKTGEMVPILIYERSLVTNILIEFAKDGTISAKMLITPWGIVDDEIEF